MPAVSAFGYHERPGQHHIPPLFDAAAPACFVTDNRVCKGMVFQPRFCKRSQVLQVRAVAPGRYSLLCGQERPYEDAVPVTAYPASGLLP